MTKHIAIFLLITVIVVPGGIAWAQADAEAAFQQGKAAYDAGRFAEARGLFLQASRTDTNNPEVFLWLGKARYQLGELDEAIAAWTKTLKLAPEEPYAKKMLETLRKRSIDVDAHIRLIELLTREALFASAKKQCDKLLGKKALTDEQRVKGLTLQAEVLLETGALESAQKVLHILQTQYAKLADPAQTALLWGRAKLRSGGENIGEGLALLKKVVADHGETPAGVRAVYELAAFNLRETPNAARAKDLAEWIAAHPNHALARKARAELLEGYLAVTRQEGTPSPGSALSASDRAAWAVSAELLKQIVKVDEALKLTKRMLEHLDKHYARNKAYGAAIDGCELLIKVSLPPSGRSAALQALGQYKAEASIQDLTDQAKAGRLPPGPLPKSLSDVLAVYQMINKEFPATPAWRAQAALAGRVHVLGATTPWPAKITGPKACHAWAVEVALPVIKANADASAVSEAVKIVTDIVKDCSKHTEPSARTMALDINAKLLAALDEADPAWVGVVWLHVDLLNAYTVAVFNDNIRAGRAETNAKLSKRQEELLATLAMLVNRQANCAANAMKKLGVHLQPWLKYGHYTVAEQAYAQLEASLLEAQKREAKLAVVGLWMQHVVAEHNRLQAAGLTVPHKLDPRLAKALEQCHVLQGGLTEGDPFLVRVRGVWNGIVDHYKNLEYFDTAESAIKVAPKKAVPTAQAYAQLQLGHLKFDLACRELNLFLKQYGASEKLTLTPTFKAAVEAYTTFILEHPDSPLRDQAETRIFEIGRIFELHKAYDVAVGVYRDFAKSAMSIKVLSFAAPGQSSAVERALYAAANALSAKARLKLVEQTQAGKEGATVPEKISDDFAAAITAYKGFIKAHPKSVLVGPVIQKIMAVALEYAKVDAWDVADGIYADLLSELKTVHRPERIEFCRGLCQMGKALPEHARKILATLTIVEPAPRRVAHRGRDDKRPASEAEEARGGRRRRADDEKTDVDTMTPLGMTDQAISGRSDLSSAASADDLTLKDTLVLAAIRKHEAGQASQIAKLRDEIAYRSAQQSQQGQERAPSRRKPILAKAEIDRLEESLNAAYAIFQTIRKTYPDSKTAEQARGEIMVMISHWRSLHQWDRSASLAVRYLADNPNDTDLPNLRLGIARDYLAWAGQPTEPKSSNQVMLAEVAARFDKAREALSKIVTDFPKLRELRQQAQWDIANSFLTQARVVDAFSPTLARGQYVRAAKELQRVADEYYDHPNIATIPKMLWDISNELAGRAYYDEAITVWNQLTIRYPTDALADQAMLKVAQTYQNNLGQPLRAAEAYQEINAAHGGNDGNMQTAIYQIGAKLKQEKRWVEALHVLEVFVDSFPRHAQAGQALTMIGQIHQANEAWDDAIRAYRRVIAEFPEGHWVKDAKWSIAECTINLSQWRAAMEAYRVYAQDYPKDEKVGEANRRIDVLKDLARYQTLVDERDQRKAFDAQYQIATIVLNQLSNRVKAVIEYRKVAAKWPKSHLADDALYAAGTTFLAMGQTDKAREVLESVAKQYPGTPLADDALYMVGKSYEDEAQRFMTATRAKSREQAQELAQSEAYVRVQMARREQRGQARLAIKGLKKAGAATQAELAEAKFAMGNEAFDMASIRLNVARARQVTETLTAAQLADRQDKINAALRRAVAAYTEASKVPGADKAGDALLRMAMIYDKWLKDAKAAMATWLEIVRQFSGTAVAEDASWRIAQHYEREGKYAEAIEAYKAFLRNYRRSPNAGNAQFAIAENHEHLGQWINAMDAYTNYINNFPKGPQVEKSRQQINWIKTYRL